MCLIALLALSCAVALAAGSAKAAPPVKFRAPGDQPLPVPGAFRMPASNGYTLYVVAFPGRTDRSGGVMIFAYKKGNSVTYRAPATITETSIQADLKELGEISVTFRRSNRAASVPCGEEEIRFDSGKYEGTVDFHGEEGYTTVEATTVPGNVEFWLAGLCGEPFLEGSSGGRRRGAALNVRNPALGPEMSVSKRRPGAAAQIAAWVSEYKDGISIRRFTSLQMPGDGFTFDRRLRTAVVRPPAPFAGSARFDLSKKAGQRWSGDLVVDLAGRPDVPLTSPLLRASLSPAG